MEIRIYSKKNVEIKSFKTKHSLLVLAPKNMLPLVLLLTKNVPIF